MIFVLPPKIPDSNTGERSRKRPRGDQLTETDDDAEDVDGDPVDTNVPSNTSSDLPPEQGAASHAKMSYKDMIDAAFDSFELDLDSDQSVLQTELVDWISNKYYRQLDDCESRKQSLRKGLYSILMKHFERIGTHESAKRQKRGTIRWRIKQGGNFEQL